MNASVKTLQASSDFQRIAKQGKRWVTQSFIVQIAPRDHTDNPVRVGYTASRRVGGAVQRNTAKRRLRAVMHLFFKESALTGWDIVLIAKDVATTYPFDKMQKDLRWALKRLEVLS